MPLSTVSSAVTASASSSATYEFSNVGNVASFDIQQVTQQLEFISPAFGAFNSAEGLIRFQLNEQALFSISGFFSGGDDSGVQFATRYNSFWRLLDEDNSTVIYLEIEESTMSASHAVNGQNDGNQASNFFLVGQPTGTLLPGEYRFVYRLTSEDSDFITALTASATGFTNLTLTSIPERSSAVLMLLAIGLLAARRR